MTVTDYTALLPPLSDTQFIQLKADIDQRGCLVPIELDEDGQILDGAHRLRACQELDIKPPTITRRGLTEEEKRAHAIALNIQRRQLDRSQRAELHRELRKAGKSLREIAEVSGVHHSTVAEDVAPVGNPTPEITGRDGKTYPATKPKLAPVLDMGEAITKRQHEQQVHYSSDTDEWATPQPLFDALDREFGFDLDVCALPSSAKCELFFTPEDDGLEQDWTGTCWMNPPYGNEIGTWMDKARAASLAGATVVCLVPARTDTGWWWATARYGEVRFIKGRLKFGNATAGAPFPSAVVVLSSETSPRVVWWEPRLEAFSDAA